jgi:DNA-directed RNA polymerase subunit RPC12/RpoP
MTNIVPFTRKADPPRMVYICSACRSPRFNLVEGGEIECADCDSVLFDRRHFATTEPEPAA